MEVKEEDIRKEVWGGSILIQFELTQNEITTLQPPNPFYVRILLYLSIYQCVNYQSNLFD
jgi:hypothetical protein